MAKVSGKINIRKQVSKLLSSISDKNREVLERRFGIDRDEAETLESIGKSYGITRERVRQIQEYGLKKLVSQGAQAVLAPVFESVEKYIKDRGGVVRESDIFGNLVKPQDAAHLSLALRLMPSIIVGKETDDMHPCFALDAATLKNTDNFVSKIHKTLGERGAPVSFADLSSMAKSELEASPDSVSAMPLDSVFSLSRRIKRGPFEYFGLAQWSSITPRGVKDKAHLVFGREKRPLHFKEISSLIDKYFASQRGRATHPQTVHNELIKDPRFVLIGRGLYALADWGYEPGTVKDVLVQIFKDAGGPMPKEEVLRLISERRFVKPNTIFLNLQNRNYFKKLEGGKYYLA